MSCLGEPPQLERAERRHRMLRSDLERLVEIGAVEHVEAADLMLRLRDRPVADLNLAVPHPNRGRLTRRLGALLRRQLNTLVRIDEKQIPQRSLLIASSDILRKRHGRSARGPATQIEPSAS